MHVRPPFLGKLSDPNSTHQGVGRRSGPHIWLRFKTVFWLWKIRNPGGGRTTSRMTPIWRPPRFEPLPPLGSGRVTCADRGGQETERRLPPEYTRLRLAIFFDSYLSFAKTSCELAREHPRPVDPWQSPEPGWREATGILRASARPSALHGQTGLARHADSGDRRTGGAGPTPPGGHNDDAGHRLRESARCCRSREARLA
jgi:hypothetical protein